MIVATVGTAYLIERAEEIASTGGLLRVLSDKAEADNARLQPMLRRDPVLLDFRFVMIYLAR